MKTKLNDIQIMRRCLELALNGAGQVSPNPLVGAVIIHNDKIISEGWHKKHGDIHAEIDAINNAQCQSFEGMTLAVNLEPCSHIGKQPPCVDVIIEKKFARVIIGMQDPNPLVSGSGIAKLCNAGIAVAVGVAEEDCKWVNRYFLKYITQQKPYIVMKVAQSLDGCIATANGESKWITCEESRRRVHVLRSEVDAVLVGVNTVIADDPRLNIRLENEQMFIKNPAIIIPDNALRTPINSNIIKQAKDRPVIIVYSDAEESKVNAFEAAGAILVNTSNMKNNSLLSHLAVEYNISSILVEGGAKIFSYFMNNNLVDELHIFYAPIIIGDGLRAFSAVETSALSDCKHYRIAGSLKSGIDEQVILIKG